MRQRRAAGFSLVELLVALAVFLVVTASVFTVLQPSRGRFAAEAERSDIEQRLRVAADTLYQDLVMAGAGPQTGPGAGPLLQYFASVLPRGLGDSPGTVRTDRITVMYVSEGAPQTTTANAVPAASGEAILNLDPGCALGDPACGFVQGQTVIVVEPSGESDVYAIDLVSGSTLLLRHLAADEPKTHPAGSRIVRAVVRSFGLEDDSAIGGDQLVREDAGGAALPVVDHVVGLTFAYYGDPLPPDVMVPAPVPAGPWDRSVTYGPQPPAAGTSETAYPPGENCTFQRDAATGEPVPRLAALAAAAGELVPLTAAQLTDGPWCPDAAAASRFDADLLRVRRLTATLRVESAVTDLRGPAGPLFARAGTATAAGSLAPDRMVRLDVAPRNLAGMR
jgi:prepilin-type N-terminal cleavage/methylation domain-containing protein